MPSTLDEVRGAALKTARAAAAAIYERRSDVGRDLDRWPGEDDLPGVVDYVTQQRRVPPEVLRADALDVLRILRYLGMRHDHQVLAAVRLARAQDATWPGVAAALGKRSPQSAEQTMQRLASQEAGGGRVAGEARRAKTAAAARAAQRVDQDAAMVGYARWLIDQAALIPDDMPPGCPDPEDLADCLPAHPGGAPESGLVGWLCVITRMLHARPDLDAEMRPVVDHWAQTLPISRTDQLPAISNT